VTLTHKSIFTTQQEQWLQLYESLNLTPRQKKIVVWGMDGRELSPNDIIRAMNTDDRDTYDREVTGLRKANILLAIRTNAQAKSYAYLRKLKTGEVPRFKVRIPDITRESEQDRAQCGGQRRDPRLGVFIYNVPYSLTYLDIKSVFSRCGEIGQINLPVDPYTHRPKGFGFVWFQSPEAAKKAIRELNGVEVGGRPIFVREYEEK
jgi:ATP-dependent DNA helicase RecG